MSNKGRRNHQKGGRGSDISEHLISGCAVFVSFSQRITSKLIHDRPRGIGVQRQLSQEKGLNLVGSAALLIGGIN